MRYHIPSVFGALSIALLLVLLFQLPANAQQLTPERHTAYADPHTAKPPRIERQGNTTQRSGCSSTIALDYNTFNEIMANETGLTYNGSWNSTTPTVYAKELTSFTDNTHTGCYTYVQTRFDSLAFANFALGTTGYIPRNGTTISFDSLGLFVGIYGDTTLGGGTMANDSLLFKIYPITGNIVSSTAIKTVVLTGYADLQPFFTGYNTLKYVQVAIGQQLSQAQSFAIKMQYLGKDTSSHCMIAYSYADSCGTVPYQGQIIPSPAFPTPFSSSASWAVVNANGTTSMQNNNYIYNIPSISYNCAFVYEQNWEMIPILSYCAVYGAHIQASSTAICNNNSISLNAFAVGTSGGAITYTWAASSGTLTSTTAQTTSLLGNTDNDVTVTLTVNDAGNIVTDSLVLSNCHLKVTLGASQTVCTASNIVIGPVVSNGIAPYTYAWSVTGDALSCATCKNPLVTLTQNSSYTVTVTDATMASATAAVSYTVTGTQNHVQLNTSSTIINCITHQNTTAVTVTGGTSPYTIYWGNGTSLTGTSPFTYSYVLADVYVISVKDAAGCITAIADTVSDDAPVVTLASSTPPSCPGQNTGSITVSVTGGVPPYIYNWSTGGGSATLSNVHAGPYQLSVRDANSCFATMFHFQLIAVNDAGYYLAISDTEANCSTVGVINTAVISGTPPYTYNWNTGATTDHISTLTPGAYTVTVTDGLGCTASNGMYLYAGCHSIISGTLFVDSNGNCLREPNEALQAGVAITATNANGNIYYGYTNTNGNYQIQVDDLGVFTLSTPASGTGICGYYTFCSNSNQTVTINALGDISSSNDIGLVSASGFNLNIHPGWSSANPGFYKEYYIQYYNNGPTAFTGPATITFTYDSNLTYLSSTGPAPVQNTIPYTLVWTVNNVPPVNGWAQLNTSFSVPLSLSTTYLLHSSFRIDPITGDCDSTDNLYRSTESVTGSHDPNAKEVSPAGNITEEDSVLKYTIHFQNTGTDSTHYIIIKDTLSPYLDPASVRNLASSHPYSSFDISGKGILTWTFNPLRLVDSITNQEGSKGFVAFSVKKKRSLPLGTSITNSATIYFDYNDGVMTNTVGNTISLTNGISQVATANAIGVSVYPNPFSSFTHFVITGVSEKFDLELYDVTGRLEKRIANIQSSQFDIDREGLACGVYLYKITIANQGGAYGKLVVQ